MMDPTSALINYICETYGLEPPRHVMGENTDEQPPTVTFFPMKHGEKTGRDVLPEKFPPRHGLSDDIS
jgi:hypothetical protein